MRSKRSRRKSTTWPGKQFTGCAPLSPELRGVAISLFVHCLNPTSQYPQPAYKLVPHGLDTVQTQAERNDAADLRRLAQVVTVRAGVCDCSLFVAAGNDPKPTGVDPSGRDHPDGH